MAKIEIAEPTWFCFNCQEITPKRITLKYMGNLVCVKSECIAAVILTEDWRITKIPEKIEQPKDCPTCNRRLPMAKRLKQTLPSKPRNPEQLLHEQQFSGDALDPTVLESLSSKIMRSAEKPPVGTIFARDMKFETLYANYENTRRIMRLASIRKDDVEVEFFTRDFGWLKCTVKLMYPLTTDMAEITEENKLREPKEGTMARKHGGTKSAKTKVDARPMNEKTGCKTGSVGDKVGTAILAYKTEEKQLEAVMEVIAESFKAKGKSTAKDAVLRQAKSWIPYLRKLHPSLYPEAEKAAKVEKPVKAAKPKAEPKKKAAKKEPATAAA